MFRSLLSLEGQSFSPADVQEAVQLCSDFPSALKFLSHECHICQEMMSFCKVGPGCGRTGVMVVNRHLLLFYEEN